MPKTSGNKMKIWRRMANLVTIKVPKEVVGEDGTKTVVEVDHTLTGRQYKMYNINIGKPPLAGLLKNLFIKGGFVNIDNVKTEGVTV